ncbi:hypothetical protein E1301_Tti024143 [Triplophysa tibetana]|uniref:MRH domain-containing protein n=1 Tax=Triplophysa tibetana TaxID=1572043 RepID=A0A5A9NZ30_9TELE|nr:hypothetical protein E1301_Tti024143 [Triplophysa tibetana]
MRIAEGGLQLIDITPIDQALLTLDRMSALTNSPVVRSWTAADTALCLTTTLGYALTLGLSFVLYRRVNGMQESVNKCTAVEYPFGTKFRVDELIIMAFQIIPHHIGSFNQVVENGEISTWIPKGDYIASNTDECSSTLSYAVSLKKPGSVSFQYIYPDNSIFFEFYVQNDQCQSTDSVNRWMTLSKRDWEYHYVQLSSGNNVLYWRTTGFSLAGSSPKPVLLKNIAISGVSYTSECFHCKPGTYSDKPGASRCIPCAVNSYSNKGATACQPCEADTYSGIGSGSCLQRPHCKQSDYFYTHTPCDSRSQTQLMFKWIEPKICSESAKGAIQLPASGEMMACPPCNPGFFSSNTSTCEPCPHGLYSNGTECSECPSGMEPVVGFEYKWWNRMPSNMRSSVFSVEFSSTDRTTGWEVAGEYIYTTPSDQDSDFMLLTLQVPGYSLPHSLSKDNERVEISKITFVFETKCTADCKLHFMAGQNERNNMFVESWSGTIGKQSYSYLIKSNSTVSFTWGFQRTGTFSMESEYSSDFAKIYSIHITNVIGGVASECRQCALAASGTDSACVPCPSGNYMVNGTGVCKSCPANTIIRPEQPIGEQACIPCGLNTDSNKGRSACISDCTLALSHKGESLNYDFSQLARVKDFQSTPRFTSKGLQYFHHFSVMLCGTQNRGLASCVENVTESKREVKGYICRSTLVPSEVRGQSVVSSQPFSIGDTLIGVTTDSKLADISSFDSYFPSKSELPDVIFYYRSRETTQACKNGRSTSVRLRCDPTVTTDKIFLPRSDILCGTRHCPTMTCSWMQQERLPCLTEEHYNNITGKCLSSDQLKIQIHEKTLQTCFAVVCRCFFLLYGLIVADLMYLFFEVIFSCVETVVLMQTSGGFSQRMTRNQVRYITFVLTTNQKELPLYFALSCCHFGDDKLTDDHVHRNHIQYLSKLHSFSRHHSPGKCKSEILDFGLARHTDDEMTGGHLVSGLHYG